MTTNHDEARAAFVAAATRSGEHIDVDALDDTLADVADKAAGTLADYRDAMNIDFYDHLPVPAFAPIVDLLAMVAGARAALGYTDTPTSREVFEQMDRDDVTTAAGDVMRLHLVSEHGDLNVLTAPDRLAALTHSLKHPGCTDATVWDELSARAVVSDLPLDMGSEAVEAALQTILDRINAPGPVTG